MYWKGLLIIEIPFIRSCTLYSWPAVQTRKCNCRTCVGKEDTFACGIYHDPANRERNIFWQVRKKSEKEKVLTLTSAWMTQNNIYNWQDSVILFEYNVTIRIQNISFPENIPQAFVSRHENIEALGDAGIKVCVPHVTFPLQH